MSKLILTEAAAPDTPAIGRVAVYPKADGNLYLKDDTGAESLLGGGGAGGDMLTGTYDSAGIAEQLAGLTATQILTNKTLADDSNEIHANLTYEQARNESGGPMTAATPVYISGYNGGLNVMLIDLADASVAATMAAIGLAQADIPNATTGHIVTNGQIINVDTSSFSVGDPLYVSETAGELTATKPTSAALVQKVGVVLRSHATLGSIDVVGAGRTNDIPNTMLDTVVRIVDDGDPTKQIAFQASGIATGNTRTITMPDADVNLAVNADLTGPVTSVGNATTLEGGRDFALSDETTALTTGTKLTWYPPYAVTLALVYASVTTAPTDATLIVDIHLNGTTIMTTDKIEIETTEFHSSDAATQPALTTTAVAQFDKVEIIVDQIGSSVAGAGLKCYLLWTRA
jgi:hypothetical protein